MFVVRGRESDREDLRAFAMAAATLGVPLASRGFIDREGVAADKTRERQLAYVLEEESPGATYKTRQLWQWWNSSTWREANPNHPLCLLWQYRRNLQLAAEREPDFAQYIFRRGKRTCAVPRSWPKSRIEESLRKL